MTTDSNRRSAAAPSLAQRLRELRAEEAGRLTHHGMVLTQEELARVLGGSEPLSGATVSAWENSSRIPTERRLAVYARLFCTHRSFTPQGLRLLGVNELTDEETARMQKLNDELQALRKQARRSNGSSLTAVRVRDSIWAFPRGEPINIVCSDADEDDWPPYARQSHLNYSRYARHADLDALIEVYAQVREDNPQSVIQILSPDSLEGEEALKHLVIIGGGAVIRATRWFIGRVNMPTVGPVEDTHIFACENDGESREFRSSYEDGIMTQDVGLFARCRHPSSPGRIVTLLSGITSRGVHGAALCFTNRIMKDVNEQYIVDHFSSASAYCLLLRVDVRGNRAHAPNLSGDGVLLYDWSDTTGTRWLSPDGC
jgi:transcriptional regulator with XRE-family HTH domain